MTNKGDKVKLWHLIFVVAVSLCSVAASWGASKASVAQASTDIEALQVKVTEVDKEVDQLKVDDAVNDETLRNIDEKLETIKDAIEKLNDKLDKMRR